MMDTLELAAEDGWTVTVRVRRSRRARRLLLKLDPATGPELVIPEGASRAQADDFAQRHVGWLRNRTARLPAAVSLVDGAVIPFMGDDHAIKHCPDMAGVVRVEQTEEGPQLRVSGGAEHLGRRLTDWLRKQARHEIGVRARAHAESLGRQVARIRITDTRSRWGSCSTTRTLSFSWRLVLAPVEVLDYVCAHEAAHLVEMNHSRRFWRLVDEICPDVNSARRWLDREGSRLHRIG